MTEQDTVEWQVPVVGQHVRIVDETYEEHDALVTSVHGVGYNDVGPSINVVYITSDQLKHDPYGQQIERLSSLGHFNATKGMPKRGRYWTNK